MGLSLVLRMLGVSGKFVAVMMLARMGSPGEVGEFGLFFGAINVLLFAIGLDFHLFVARELLAVESRAERLRILAGQATLDFTIYVVVLLSGAMVRVFGGAHLGSTPVLWLVAILVLDHLAQELSRLFTILRLPNEANIIYAIKTGLWAWVAGAGLYLRVLPPRSSSLYLFWLLADGVAVAMGSVFMARMFRGVRLRLPDGFRAWLVRGIKVSRWFYVTSVATMCLAYVDRFIIAQKVSLAEVGRYAFWQSIVALLPVVAYAMAGMHFLPLLIESYKKGDLSRFAGYRRQFLSRTLLVCGAAGVCILAISPLAPALLGKQGFEMPWVLVGLMALALCINAMWQVPYQVLYSAGDDRFLAAAVTAITVGATLCSFALVAGFGVPGAIMASVASNATMYLVLDRRSRQHVSTAGIIPLMQKP